MGRVWERPVSTDLVVSLGPGVTGADSRELSVLPSGSSYVQKRCTGLTSLHAYRNRAGLGFLDAAWTGLQEGISGSHNQVRMF